MAALLPVLVSTPLQGQDAAVRSIVLAPFGGQGSNMAAMVRQETEAYLAERPGLVVVALADLFEAVAQTVEIGLERAQLECIQTRQLASIEAIDLVLCGSLVGTRDGFRLDMSLFRGGGRLSHDRATGADRAELVEDALARLEGWLSGGGPSAALTSSER